MLQSELVELADRICSRKAESQTVEVKAAHRGCPEKLRDTLSSFSNQDSGGVIVFGLDEKAAAAKYDELGMTLGEALLTPTRIYVKAVMQLIDSVTVKSISHITGGGFYENIPRALPKGLSAKIARSDVQVLPIFDVIAKTGNIPERDMFNTFNMGVGMTFVVDPADVDKAIAAVKAAGEEAYVLGTLVESDEGVIIG